MKKWIFTFTILCTCILAHSQIDIYIEDLTSKRFLLGIDGYVQNTEGVSKLIIQKLDMQEHQLQIKTIGDKRLITRKLELKNKGLHHYVLTTNFEGTLQLRYRGIISAAPAGVITMDQQKILPLKHEPVITIAATDKPKDTPSKAIEEQPKITTPQKPKEVTPEKPKTTQVVNAVVKPKETIKDKAPVKPESKPTPEQSKATTSVQTTPADVAPKPTLSPLELALKNMRSKTYEFDKVGEAEKVLTGTPLSTADMKLLLATTTFDQVKIELIYQFRNQITDKENFKELLNTLTYEHSKKMLEKRLADD